MKGELIMAEIVTKQNVADAAKELACLFGANKNVYRVKPSIQDGLKPGKIILCLVVKRTSTNKYKT